MSTKLTPELVKELMDQGMKQAAIARKYGATRQWVSFLAKQAGEKSITTRVTENFPWEVGDEYKISTLYRYVRLHGSIMLGGSDQISASSLSQMRSFYKKLITFNQVIDFAPGYPTIPANSNAPSFSYAPRAKNDEDYIIKIKPVINRHRRRKKIWRLPKQLP